MLQRFQDFVTGIAVCYKCIQKIKTTEMTELGLRSTHAMCLFFLAHEPDGLTAAQLCQLCAEDKAAISRNIATLQGKGYIETGDKKYRAKLQLTESGREIAGQIDKLIEDWVTAGSDGLSEEDRATFYRALTHISQNLRRSIDRRQGESESDDSVEAAE